MDDIAVLLHEAPGAAKIKSGISSRKARLSKEDLRFFTSSLSQLLEGGIPILQALQTLKKTSRKKALTRFLKSLQEKIRDGKSFSQALDSEGSLPGLLVQVMHAGETAGELPKVMADLAKYMEKEQNLKRKINEALAYPAFILVMGIATFTVLMKFVIPRIAGIYEDFGGQLPWMTQMVLTASRLFLPFLLVFSGATAFLTYFLMNQKSWFYSLLDRMPLLGSLLQMSSRVQFSRLLALLLDSGVSILTALEITAKTFPESSFLRSDITVFRQELADGKKISQVLENKSWLDPLSYMLIVSGEEAGRLSAALRCIAETSESKVEARIQFMIKLLEPALILGVGIAIGAVVIAAILPIFDMSGLIK